MAETTAHDQDVEREHAADLLQELARELRGEDTANVQVGNKTLTLTPASTVEYGISVEERSPMFGGDREEITVTLEWKVPKPES
ncbi:amphi-Trp domain-containing protein [Natrarchaeobaculum aegyptiacum]|uniref:Amphi-Trp domain-containing protein n=1 Tax=Natrarchaeobaculum aegyptiacum TaxID=745377 RepID=A0A2Z2HPB9_9EURY|nr:amphi-Trp domain-containing protein [Natrarchaeobaculum aegyptiacum]ARS88811.1 amphi-Trp domain-containing protein [Natrarchaeobaculum aegyptiacum]